MQITIPKKRNPSIWKQNKEIINQLIQSNSKKRTPLWFTFKQYCIYSQKFLQADNTIFQSKSNDVLYLTNIEIKFIQEQYTYLKGDDLKSQRDQMFKIVQMIKYAWQNIIRIISGLKDYKDNNLGIYTDQNIQMHLARLQQMLKQIKSNGYRCSIYNKDNAYIKEIIDKEINQQLVFVKLLQNILKTQTTKILQYRNNYRENQKQQQEKQQQKTKNINNIVKVNQYFQKKYIHGNNNKKYDNNDIINQQKQRRKFNAAVIRYHMQQSQRR